MDDRMKMAKTANIVDLTVEDKNAEDIKVPLISESLEGKVVPVYVISDEEWLSNLSEKEKNWYEKNLTSYDDIDKMMITCTACFKQTNHKKFGEVSRHPTLGVAMCKNCKNFYFDGAWTKDDEGSFEFCGWCAQGGILMLCADDRCPNAFCKACIKRNLGRNELTTIENCDDWKCFECKPKQIRVQRALYYSIYKYWKAIGVEDKRKVRHQRLKNEPVHKNKVKMNFKRSSSGNILKNIQIGDDTSNENTYSSDEVQPLSTISQCLKYAEEVSDLFSDGLKSEKKKWKKCKREDEASDEKVVWKHAKRVAKMIAIQNKGLGRLVELIVENVSKDCPNYDTKELKNLAHYELNSSQDSLSYKDATSKEGINLEIDESTSQNIEHPVQSETEDPKIIIRKDIYDKTPNLNKNKEEIINLPLYSPEQVYPSSPTKTVENVTPPHRECKNTELLKTSSPVPVIRTSSKTDKSLNGNVIHLERISESPIPGNCSMDIQEKLNDSHEKTQARSNGKEQSGNKSKTVKDINTIEDFEINQLCNIKALKGKCNRNPSIKDQKYPQSISENSELKIAVSLEKEPMSVEVKFKSMDRTSELAEYAVLQSSLSESSDNEKVEIESPVTADQNPTKISKERKFYNDVPKYSLAKAAVLGSTSLSDNSTDGQHDHANSKKTSNKFSQQTLQNKNESSPKKRNFGNSYKSVPRFLKVKLSESESSNNSDLEIQNEKKKKSKIYDKYHKQEELLSHDELKKDHDELEIIGYPKITNNKRKRTYVSLTDSDASTSENDWSSGENCETLPFHRNHRSIKKKGNCDSSTDDLSEEEPRYKRRRKRAKFASSSSSSDNDKSHAEEDSPQKRKNIRKIIDDKKLSTDTRKAELEEKERQERMKDRQKQYNTLFDLKRSEKITELPLDYDQHTKKIIVSVDHHLVQKMKPHQTRGIKFMWDAVIESKKDLLEGKNPGGAILAHCMGLGKSLQTIGLVHTLMINFPGEIRCVLVLAPVNTLKNWVDEFNKWLRGPLFDDLQVYEISNEKNSRDRADYLKLWKDEGGVMILGYDLFRILTTSKKFQKKELEIFRGTLLNPGPQLVICDEGHILRSLKSGINAALNAISTKRRIILTGTPLQNNLMEYYAMIDFVKPNLLGTVKEFKNRFVNPIQNGQHKDSTPRDVRKMKQRAHILSEKLKGCVQRLDYNVLTPFLQPKHEYVLHICLTDIQKKLYKFYLDHYTSGGQIGQEGKLEGGKKGGLFNDVYNLSRIWSHPYILEMHYENEKRDMKKFIIDDSGDERSSINHIASKTRNYDKSTLADWWNKLLDSDSTDTDRNNLRKISNGAKMILLLDILKETELIGDKVLVFSQSLLSLDLIEDFLSMIDNSDEKITKNPALQKCFNGSWRHQRDYYRMDGSTPLDVRKKWCNSFNKVSNHRMRLFLISTKAGGLGINLVAANRVIIFDASWNPAHDVQSIFRVYRFGQEKPVYIYRFLAKGTMEQKIYDRQVTKQSLSARVVDEQQIERHFTMNELAELYEYSDEKDETYKVPKVPKDLLLAELLKKHGSMIWTYHDHDSLLENQGDENLTEEERKAAWEEFENEKKGISNFSEVGELNPNLLLSNINPAQIQAQYRIQYPHLTDEQVIQATRAYIMQVQSGITRKPAYDKSHYQQEMAKAKAQQQMMYPGLYQRTNNTSNSRNNVQNLQQQQQQEYAQAQQIQQQYLQAQQAQLQALQRAALIQNLQQQVAKNQNKKQQPSSSSSTRRQQDELITLSSDEETGSNSGAVLLDGEPEVQAVERSVPSSSSSRRGRPRLDPDTDDILG